MVQILIVADDLTGALDSAVAFAGPERRVYVARRISDIPAAIERNPLVLGVNTASREESEEAAVQSIEAVAQAIDLSAVDILIKKVDSRLKGHPGMETRTLARLVGCQRIIALPAIPEMGRIQVNGELKGQGVDSPICIAARFGGGVEIPDGVTPAELDRAMSRDLEGIVWAGARGMTYALARRMYGNAESYRMALRSPAFFAFGSRDPITVAQVRQLTGVVDVSMAPNGQVPSLERNGPLRAVSITPGETEVHPAVAQVAFADGIARELTRSKPRSLLAGGGETVNAILDLLQIGVLEVMAEVAPGLPACSVNAPWGPLMLVTKSGGFGEEALLAQLAGGIVFGEKLESPREETT